MSLRDYKSLKSRGEIAPGLQIPEEQRGDRAEFSNTCGAVGGCKDYKSLQSKMYIVQELVRFLPGGHDLPEDGKFSDMVGVVIGHNPNLAKDCETCGVGDRRIEIYLRI